jgi:hypothetical protein
VSRARTTVGTARDSGTATAELAVSLPALVLLLVVGLGALAVVRDQIEVVALAREVALAQARGEPSPTVPGVTVEVSRDAETVRVVVTRHRRPLGVLPGVDVRATAVAAIEPGE